MSLSKTHLFLLSTGSTQEDPSQHNCKIVEWDIKNKIKQTKSEEKWTLCQKATDYWIGMMTKMQNPTFAYGNCVHFLFFFFFSFISLGSQTES